MLAVSILARARWHGIRIFTLLGVTAGLLPALALAAPELSGPTSVSPGQQVTFHAAGLPPGDMVQVGLQESDQAGQNVSTAPDGFTSATVDSAGVADLVFRWPQHYDVCRGTAGYPTPTECVNR
jgi:hypothetical protein